MQGRCWCCWQWTSSIPVTECWTQFHFTVVHCFLIIVVLIKLKSWDSQSGQGFVLLEQQLWNLSEVVLVETPEWTNGHWEALTEKTQAGKCAGAGLRVSQSLQLLQLIKRSSLHGADLVLHQVTEKTGTGAERSAGDQFRLPESMVWIWWGNLLFYFLLGGTLGDR